MSICRSNPGLRTLRSKNSIDSITKCGSEGISFQAWKRKSHVARICDTRYPFGLTDPPNDVAPLSGASDSTAPKEGRRIFTSSVFPSAIPVSTLFQRTLKIRASKHQSLTCSTATVSQSTTALHQLAGQTNIAHEVCHRVRDPPLAFSRPLMRRATAFCVTLGASRMARIARRSCAPGMHNEHKIKGMRYAFCVMHCLFFVFPSFKLSFWRPL